ncbi:MAG: Eco57I restriction-modification methylase domain-containing protein, partial [Euryarchaeota archaeon]|nr:Eco57I restriction-modification methylase domain-containing protein [Euryarchaeota archaeon]
TPDYIVKYIVRNTLTPILDERRIAWKEKGLGERPFLHDILSIKVLDPAMGSGHFLVEACEFLANKLVEAWGEARPEELESVEVAEHDVHWARREVVRHCIFGVDLNPMAVELAKLSLWLETVAANKPLTFLDHHLKVGNSLIGAKVEDLKSLPSKEKKEAAENGKKQLKTSTLWDFTVKKHFEELLAKYGEFAAHPDDDLKSVKQKEQEYDALQKSEINRRLHELANVWVSTYFGAAPPPDEYAEMQNEMNPKDFPDWSRWRGREWFRHAQEIADEKRFFHWELEFPESFYEKGAPKEKPGWDAVVGNPPYIPIAGIMPLMREIYKKLYNTFDYRYDIFGLFIESGYNLLRRQGAFGMIFSSVFLNSDSFTNLREHILKSTTIHKLVYFGDGTFTEAVVPTMILITQSCEFDKSHDIEIIAEPKIADLDKNIFYRVRQSHFLNCLNFSFNLNLSNEIFKFLSDISKISDKIGNLTRTNRGVITGDDKRFIYRVAETKKHKKVIRGKNIERFWLEWDGEYVYYGTRDEIHDPSNEENFLTPEKLFVRRVGDTLTCAFDIEQLYCLDTLYTVVNISSNLNLKYILVLLNSRLLSVVYKLMVPIKGRTFPEVRIFDFNELPIRRISFTTPPDRRAALATEAKTLYSEFLGAPGAEDLDRINRMDWINTAANPVNPVHPVQTVASLSTAPDSRKILDFVSMRLSAAPEESDVVHDLLAHLAEQMIDMNKKKNAEIKGFLRWLEGEIGAPVEELTNKT